MGKIKFTLILSILILCATIFCACNVSNDVESKDDLQSAIDHNNALYETMQPLSKKYNIIERNIKEIPLQNYTLDSFKVYDKYGVKFAGLLVENKTIYHNWYSIQANENGVINIEMFCVARKPSKLGWESRVHDRTLTINFEPYNGLFFANIGGERAYKNTRFFTPHSDEILFPVITNVTQFETTKIISSDNYGTYVISYIKIIFEDTTYNKATIMEYRFSARTGRTYDFESVFEYGEVL